MRPYFDSDYAAAMRESEAQAKRRRELDEAHDQQWKRERDEHYAAQRTEDEMVDAMTRAAEEERLEAEVRYYTDR